MGQAIYRVWGLFGWQANAKTWGKTLLQFAVKIASHALYFQIMRKLFRLCFPAEEHEWARSGRWDGSGSRLPGDNHRYTPPIPFQLNWTEPNRTEPKRTELNHSRMQPETEPESYKSSTNSNILLFLCLYCDAISLWPGIAVSFAPSTVACWLREMQFLIFA